MEVREEKNRKRKREKGDGNALILANVSGKYLRLKNSNVTRLSFLNSKYSVLLALSFSFAFFPRLIFKLASGLTQL